MTNDHTPQQQDAGLGPETQDPGRQEPDRQDLSSRSPSVSIAASTAHLEIGDRIAATIQSLDSEGRPVFETDTARYALKPSANLKPQDTIGLVIIEAERVVKAALETVNNQLLEKAIEVTVTITGLKAGFEQAPPEGGADQAPSADISKTQFYSKPTGQTKDPLDPGLSSLAGDVVLPQTTPALTDNTSQIGNPNQIGAQKTPQNVAQHGAIKTSAHLPLNAPSAAMLMANTESPGSTVAATAEKVAQFMADDAKGLLTIPINTKALSTRNGAVTLTYVDPTLSTAKTLRVEQVIGIKQADLQALTDLKIPANFLSSSDQSPSLIQTTADRYLVPRPVSNALIGSFLAIQSPDEESAAPSAQGLASGVAAPSSSTGPVYQAQLSPLTPVQANGDAAPLAGGTPDAGSSKTDTLEFRLFTQKTSAPLGSLPISAVRILDSRLSPAGPVTTVTADTALGRLTMTVPASERPIAGDFIQLLGGPDNKAGAVTDGTDMAPSRPATAPGLSSLPAYTDPAPHNPAPHNPAAPNPGAQSPAPLGDVAVSVGLVQNLAPPVFSAPVFDGSAFAPSTYGIDGEMAAYEQSFQRAVTAELPGDPSIADTSARQGPKITNAVLFLLTALKKGGLSGQGSGAAASPLSEKIMGLMREFPALQSAVQDQPIGEWRLLSLPLEVRDGIAQMISFAFRESVSDRDAGGNSQDPADQQTPNRQEFELRVGFSILGDIILSGLIEERRFDLGVLSERSFSEALKGDLAALFRDALTANGFAGRLYFSSPKQS